MNLKDIANTLGIPLPILMTGRAGKPNLKLVKPEKKPVDSPKPNEWSN